MKKNWKKIVALILAIALVGTSGILDPDKWLKASQDSQEKYVEETTTDKQEVVVEDTPTETKQEIEIESEPESKQDEKLAEEKSEEKKEETPASTEGKSEEVAKTEESKEEDSSEEEKEEEEIAMPAASFSQVASNGVKVNVNAPEGAFPEGTMMKVTAISDNQALNLYEKTIDGKEEAVDAVGVDITFFDADGKEIEPKKAISVSMKTSRLDGDDFSVVHQKDNGSVEVVTEQASATGASFKANDFSVYVIGSTTGEEEDVVEDTISVTFRFLTSDKVTLRESYEEEIEKNSDGKYVIEYEVPSIAGMTMTMEAEEGFTLEGNIVKASIEAQEDFVVDIIYSSAKANYTVKHLFEEIDGTYKANDALTETIEGEVGLSTNVGSKIKNVNGFISPEADAIDEQEIKADGSTVVEIKYPRSTYRVVYNTQGGSYIKALSGKHGEEVAIYEGTAATEGTNELVCGKEAHKHSAKPSGTPTDNQVSSGTVSGCYKATGTKKLISSGYNNKSWSLSCGKTEHTHSDACYKKTAGTEASWENAPTRQGYKFVGWYLDEACTKPADSKMTLTDNVTVYAKWEAQVVRYTVVYLIENADDNGYSYLTSQEKQATTGSTVTYKASEGTPSGLDTTNFTYEGATSATVKADGSTVITVKYSRNVYTITWKGTYYKSTSSSENVKKTAELKAKYGANITDLWKATFNTPYPNYAWNFTTNNNDKFVNIDTMPSGNKDVYAFYFATSNVQTLHYWLEGYKGSETKVKDGVTYGLYKAIDVKFNYLYDDADFYEIIGYKKGTYEGCTFGKSTSNGQQVHFYYLCQSYNLDLYGYNGKKISSNSVKLGSDFKKYLQEPAAPVSGAKFLGWFVDPECTEKYEGDCSMPRGLALYASWKLPTYTISYMSNDEKIKEEEIEYNSSAESYIPSETGYVFEGWYTEDGEEFDESAPVTRDITVYARWTKKLSTTYTIKYVTETGEVVFDEETYSAKIGKVIKIDAKAPEGIYTGYIVDKASETITLDEDSSKNVVEFVYSAFSDSKYKVEYIDSATNQVVNSTDWIDVTANKIKVKASNKMIPVGYKLSGEASKWLTVSKLQEKNIVQFTVSPVAYKISYANVDAAWAEKQVQTYTINEEVFIATPVKQGYTFIGWDYGPAGVEAKVNSHDPIYTRIEKGSCADLIFTARWAKLQAEDKEFTYDGKNHKLTEAEVVGEDKAGYQISYSLDKDGTYSNEIPTGKDAGTYVVYVKAEKDGYQTLTAVVTVIINPAELTVVTESKSKIYDGDALTANGTITGFVNEETATFKVTGTQTEVGSSDNTYEISWDKTAKEKNYTVNKTIGKLTVTENANEIVVTTTGGEFTYDGQAHGATVDVSGLPKGYKVETSTSSATATNVADGEVKATCDTLVIKNAKGNDVTSKLNIKYVDGTIKINPATLTVVTKVAEKTYDGTALKAEGSISGFVGDQTATFKVTGTQTEAGSSDNTYSLKFDKTAVESNYTVSETIGKLTVNDYAGEITVTTTGGTFVYDGKVHGATVGAIALPVGYTLEKAASSATATDVENGTVTATCDTLIIKNASGQDVTKKLNIVYENGFIQITPATLIVTTPNASKTYDGEPLTAEGKIEGLVNSDKVGLETTGKQTEVGTSKNTYTLKWNGTAKEKNYTVTERIGFLTVKEYDGEIIVKTTGGEFTYDGKEHGATVEEITLPAGYVLDSAESSATATHVSDGTVTATCNTLVIKNLAEVDVTSRLNIKYVNGTIKINPATLTVVTPSDSKVYDGKALTKDGEISGFVNGETADFTTTGSQTEVGSSDNTYEIDWSKKGTFLELGGTLAQETDYAVSESIGKLTVTENADEIVVTTTGGTFTYDGKEHKAEVSVSELPEGYSVKTAISNDSAKDVTKGAIVANCDKLEIVNAKGTDVTSKLNIRYVDGSIQINPAVVTVVTPDASKTYDGEALTAEGTCTGIVEGESATFKTTGSQASVGTSKNTYSITWGENTKASNYTIAESIGTLTVNEYVGTITVTATGGTYTYDGKAHGAIVTVSELPAGYVLGTATASKTVTNVEDGEVKVKCDSIIIKNAAGEDVTSKLNLSYVEGTIKVTPATLTVATESDSKVYDGKALTADGSISGFVNQETASFAVTGSRTAVGTSDNTYSLTWNGNAKAGNYKIVETIGKLTVTESTDEIVVTTTGGTFTYDGQAHGANVNVSGIPVGYTVKKAVSNDTAKDVADGTVIANCDELQIVNTEGEDVTGKLNIRYVNGTIQVTPATLTIETSSATKTYDGTVLTAEGSITGFVNSEVATFNVTGSQTEVGESQNSYTLAWDGTAKEGNYKLSTSIGTLKVQEYAGEITATTVGGTYTYDGKAHGASVIVSKLPSGYTLESALSSATVTNVAEGTVKATCDTLVIKNAAGIDVTDQLNIKKVNADLVVTPAALTVTTPSMSKVYDGTALTAEGSISGFVNGETATFTTTGTQSQVGESKNTYAIEWDGTAVKTNYTISESVGTLVVTQSTDEIVVTTVGGTFTYDGEAHGATVSVSTLSAGYTLETAVSSATVTNVADGEVKATCDTLVIKNAAGEDVTKELNINYSDGTIQITPATLTVKTSDASKTYDGTALTAAGDIFGLVNSESVGFTTTGSQTAVGTSENTYELTFAAEGNDSTAVESNYKISETIGTLEVVESTAEITVITTGGTYTYDGKAHGATVSVSTLPAGYSLEKAISNDAVTNVSEGKVTADCDELVIRNAEGKDVTSKLNLTYVEGNIQITPATLTVITPSDSKVYDGQALTSNGSISGFIGDETATFTTTGSQTAVGTTANTYSLVFDQNAVSSNYQVSETIGTLAVTENENEIVVTTTGGTFTYDGQAHGASVSVSTLPTGYRTENAKSDDTKTNVFGGAVTADCDHISIMNAENEDVTSKLNITYVDGSIDITPAKLTVETPTREKTYDGTPLTAAGNISGFVNGETAEFVTTGTQTMVGTSANTYSLAFSKTAVSSNYQIEETIGTLTVNEYAGEITATTTGGTFTYDGEAHGATVSVSELPTGYTLESATSSATATHVAEGTVEATCDTLVIKNAEGEDVTSKLNVRKVNGSISITPKALTITTSSASKVYDGTALTSEEVSIEGIVETQGFFSNLFNTNKPVTLVATGSRTPVGSSPNTYSITWDGTSAESDYTITKEELGTLTVTQNADEIVVTTTGGTYTYDGEAHGATVSVSELPKGYTLQSSLSNDTATNVADGKVTANCDSLVITNDEGEDVTSDLNIRYVNGTIEITPATLTITTPSTSKTYDGTALTAEGSISGFVNGETATFATTGSQTAVGISANTYSLVFDQSAKETNYKVEKSVGKLTVDEYAEEITATVTGGTYTYDGKAHGAVVSVSELPAGYTLESAESSKTATHVAEGTVPATCDTLIIRNAEGEDVTAKLNINRVAGNITITPATLTIVTASNSKVYDGEVLTAEGSISGFVNEEIATFTVTGSQSAVGTSNNTYTIDWDGTATESDYTINESVGTLVVTEHADEIVVTTTGGTYTYDGQVHGATVEVSALPKGYRVETATASATATHVKEGEVPATCDTLVIRNATGEDVTSKLNIKYVGGAIKITPATLVVTTSGASKTYDGTALTAEGSISGFVNEETATFTVTGTQTVVGSTDNSYNLAWNGEAEETDYTISETIGKLVVSEYAGTITVTTNGGEFTYDGQSHGTTVSVSTLPTGYTLEKATASATVTHVAEGEVTATCDTLVIRNAEGEDVTDKLNIKFDNHVIKVNPTVLTVTTSDADKVYDGETLTAEGNISGFVNGETATFAVTGSQTTVGSSDNTYSIEWTGTAVPTDYIVSPTVGKLTITESEDQIVVTTTGGTFTYDGQPHGATVSVTTLPTGYKLDTATSDDTATHVSEGKVTATCDTLVIKNTQNEDVTSKLRIKYVDGNIQIEPKELTVTTESSEKTYNGTALTAGGSISGFVNGETATFAVTGSQTKVGNSNNTYSIIFNQSAAADDYKVSETIGTLTVNEYAGQITVTTKADEFTYDGKSHGTTVEVSELPAGYRLVTAESSATVTHVAEGDVTATCDKLVILNADGEDVTEKLNIKREDHVIKVNPATITVQTSDGNKVYDGETLTAEGSITGFVNDETATFTVTGSQTKVGSSDNTYSIVWDESAAESDYNVVPTVGKLIVTENADEIIVTTTGGTFTYDGTVHGATVSVSTLPKGYVLVKATSNDTATNVLDGTVTANCDQLVIKNADGKDVTNELNITYVDDSITITPAEITIETPDASKVYDGKALTSEGSISGFVNGETATFNTTGTRTSVGSTENTYSLVWDGSAKETNYHVTATTGTLTVSEYTGEIIVTTTGGEFTYDGQPHGATVDVSSLPDGYKVVSSNSTATATDVTESGVKATCDELVILNAQGEDVTDKLNIVNVDATITITPAPLIITTNSYSKVYDGEALTASGNITGFVNGETATFTVTGSQIEVGNGKNTYGLKFDQSAKESNYSISESIGTLVVTENSDEIVVTTTGGTYTYDGKAHEAAVSVSTLPAGYILETATSDDAAVNVSDGTVAATCDTLVIKNAQGKDVTKELNITYVDASIEITPVTLTVVTASAEKTYNGKSLTASGSITGFVNGETATFAVTGTQTKVGTSNNTYSLEWNGTATESNYTISESIGTLKVNQYAGEITVTTEGGEFTYDGQPHSGTVDVSTLPEGYTVEKSTSTETVTDVEDGTKEITCDDLIIRNAEGEDVTSELNIKRTEDIIKVVPATLTVVTPSKNKVYDGTALTAEGSISGFVNGESATFTTTGTQTTVGTSDNTYTLTYDGTATESNYTISESIGTLSVSEYAGEIVVTTKGGTHTYDGEPHGATVEVSKLPTGYTLEKAESSTTVTNVADGSIPAICDTIIIRNAEGDNVTEKLNIKNVEELITITPAPLTIEMSSGTKVYDGDALTAEGKITGLVNGETITLNATGSQTKVGTSDNTYELVWDGTATESNYQISDVIGKLTVTENADEIVVTITGGKFIYDGKEHKATVEVSELPKGYTLEKAESSTTVVDVSAEPVQAACDILVIRNAEGEDVTSQLNITYVSGDMKVNPAELVITTPDAEKTYDGRELQAEGTISGFAEGETATFKTTGSQIDADESENTYNLTFNRNAKQSNYKITETTGTLEVDKKPVVLVSGSDSKSYDGTPLTNETVSEEPGKEFVAGEGADYIMSGSQTLVGTSDNTFAYAMYSNTKAENYEIKTKFGELKVTDGTGIGDSPLDPEIIIQKEHEAGVFTLGDTVTFTISAKNIYSEAKTLTITEQEGVSIDGEGNTKSFENVEAGKTVTATATYVLTEEDILAGNYKNVASVSFGEGTPSFDGEDDIDLEKVSQLNVKKSVVEPKDEYKIGDVITYNISVENAGNITLHNIQIEDQMQGASGTVTFTDAAEGTVKDNTVTIGAIAPEKTVNLTCTYTVTKDDASAEISNKVVVTSDEEPDEPDTDETETVKIENLYTLTIHYKTLSGEKVADDYVQKFSAGSQFRVESPEKKGYTPGYDVIESDEDGMPAEDLTFTVFYVADPIIIIDEDETTEEEKTPDENNDSNKPGRKSSDNQISDNGQENPSSSIHNTAVVKPTKNGGYELVSIMEQETPLANSQLDDHKCCILHALLMLLALIIYAMYSDKRKKLQAEIFELRENLETEKKKRGISSDYLKKSGKN